MALPAYYLDEVGGLLGEGKGFSGHSEGEGKAHGYKRLIDLQPGEKLLQSKLHEACT